MLKNSTHQTASHRWYSMLLSLLPCVYYIYYICIGILVSILPEFRYTSSINCSLMKLINLATEGQWVFFIIIIRLSSNPYACDQKIFIRFKSETDLHASRVYSIIITGTVHVGSVYKWIINYNIIHVMENEKSTIDHRK